MSRSEILSQHTLEDCRALVRRGTPVAPRPPDAIFRAPHSALRALVTKPLRASITGWPGVVLRAALDRPGWVAFAFYFALIAAVLAGSLTLGLAGDEAGYVGPVTLEYARHLLKPYPLNDSGHPMIYAWFVAVIWKMFGQSLPVAYLSIWCWGALALLGLHRLAGETIATERSPLHRRAGPLAALALFATPLFIAYTAQYLDPIPCLAVNLWAIVAWRRRQRGWLAFWLTLLALTRITGCLAVLGLGLFDAVWTLAGRRAGPGGRWRALGRAMAPYAITGALFGLYVGIKLGVYKHPMTVYAGGPESILHPTLEHFLQQWQWMRLYLFDYPRHSFMPLLAVAGAAALTRAWFWISQLGFPAPPPKDGAAPVEAPPVWAVYLAFAASLAPPVLLCLVHPYYPQPRWFLGCHALFILLGVQGLLYLVRRPWPLAAALLLAWGLLQGARWRADWFATLAPRQAKYPMVMLPDMDLSVLGQKRAYQDCADAITSGSRNPLILAGYPTCGTLSPRTSGYLPYDAANVGLSWLKSAERIGNFLRTNGAGHDRIFLLSSTLDVDSDRQLAAQTLLAHPEFALVRSFTLDRANWLRLYATK